MSLGERIRNARDNKGLKQSELAELIEVKSAAVISNWEKDINKPDADKIIKLCEVLDISASYLLDYYGNATHLSFDEQLHIKKYHDLDEHGKKIVTFVLDEEYNRVTKKNMVSSSEQPNIIQLSFSGAKVSAGVGDELMDYEQWEKVSVQETAESRKADFILIVDGDSMEPQYSNDDYVMVRSQPAVDIGQIGIFDVDGKGYMKKFGGDRLISLNSKYPDIVINKNTQYKCFGLVIGKTAIIAD